MPMTYNDFDDAEGAPEPGQEEGAQPERKEGEEPRTAVINSEICPGMNPGDVLTLRIESVRDGEYEVSYEAPEEKGGQAAERGDLGGAPEPAGAYDSMMD